MLNNFRFLMALIFSIILIHAHWESLFWKITKDLIGEQNYPYSLEVFCAIVIFLVFSALYIGLSKLVDKLFIKPSNQAEVEKDHNDYLIVMKFFMVAYAIKLATIPSIGIKLETSKLVEFCKITNKNDDPSCTYHIKNPIAVVDTRNTPSSKEKDDN